MDNNREDFITKEEAAQFITSFLKAEIGKRQEEMLKSLNKKLEELGMKNQSAYHKNSHEEYFAMLEKEKFDFRYDKLVLTNKIGEVLDIMQDESGVTKAWVAERMGITKQALDKLCKTPNPSMESVIKAILIMKYRFTDLFFFEVVKGDKSGNNSNKEL